MLNLNYSTYDVLAMMRDADGPINPTSDQIARFDADLLKDNEETLLRIMKEKGIDPSKSKKSTVLLYSRFGAGTLSQRIRVACDYFKNTSGV